MGLIEKAFQVDDSASSQDGNRGVQQGQASDTGVLRPNMGQQQNTQKNTMPRNASGVSAQYKHFDLDMLRLKRQGFYTTSDEATQLALELRYLKRRLLRTLGFLRSKSKNNGLSGRGGDRRNTVMVTSTRPAEGKTFTSINLALSQP